MYVYVCIYIYIYICIYILHSIKYTYGYDLSFAPTGKLILVNPNLGAGGVFLPFPSWFSFNNCKTVKAVNLAFCSNK